MKERIFRNLPLVVGIGLPALIVVLLFVFTYLLPNMLVKPGYNFLYLGTRDYSGSGTFKVQGQQLVFQCDNTQPRYPHDSSCEQQLERAKLYTYDVHTGANTMVEFSQAQQFQLSPSDVSPDGYHFLDTQQGGEFFVFPLFVGSGGQSSFAVEKNGWLRKAVTLSGSTYNIEFLGWIVP